MARAARLAAFGAGGVLFLPYSESSLKLFAGFLVLTLGLVALRASLRDDLAKARSNLIVALGLIVLIEAFAPLHWTATIK
jgi:hypothetical protein